MNNKEILIAVAIMAVVTYLSRCISLVLFKKIIKNKFFYSFLNYTPFTVLSALIFPAIFKSTGSLISAVCGTVCALVLSYFKKGLLFVAIGAVATVYIVEQLMVLI